MPNIQKIDAHHQRIKEIDAAIRDCSKFQDRKAFITLEGGKRELMSDVQLEELRAAELKKLEASN